MSAIVDFLASVAAGVALRMARLIGSNGESTPLLLIASLVSETGANVGLREAELERLDEEEEGEIKETTDEDNEEDEEACARANKPLLALVQVEELHIGNNKKISC